jgi:hypothetical protein
MIVEAIVLHRSFTGARVACRAWLNVSKNGQLDVHGELVQLLASATNIARTDSV